ncbi:MAG: 2-oxoacid:acceptor oxidoreductase family protein [Coriobacteriales bacterium]|nr:2-oxoacid:acceptor oxidoreductase family protein [Coriobacteriales bacterium]
MASTRIVLAGFGGQGILFAGKLIAYAGLIEDREVSWLPSYGPEMRGGTANCSVTVATEPIGSPLVLDPNVLVAMNQPSLDKFVDTVVPGGFIIADSTMVPNIPDAASLANPGITVYAIPATELAEKNDLKGLANIILAGKLWECTHFCERETLSAALAKCVPPRKQHLLEPNERALQLGIES